MERSLKDLLSRLPIPGLKESANRHQIAEILCKELTIPIKPNQISYKDEIITIAVPPVVKSAIRIKQQKLIELLSKEGVVVRSFR